ncbi:hypothetical protein [Dyadobacter jiangsuensis]|nr:hypothetical protein [Dyadobacter jiangsuensis]
MAEVQPMRLKPTPEAEEMLKGLAAVQQISKNLDLLAKEGNVSDEILMMVRTELMAAGQLISKGLK